MKKGIAKPVDPVYINLFEIRFKSDILKMHQALILTEQVVRISYTDNTGMTESGFDLSMFIKNEIDISFNQNIIDGKVQPLAIVEKLKSRLSDKDEPGNMTIKLLVHDRYGKVVRKLTFYGCKVSRIDGHKDFDYRFQDIRELDVKFTYEKLKIKN